MSAPGSTATAAPTRRRHHRILNGIQLQGYKLFFANLGKFIIVAFYFILLQTLKGQHTTIFGGYRRLPDVKGTWDSLLSASIYHGGLIHLMSKPAWDSMRHVVFRGVLEGVLGIVLYRQIGFNVKKYREKKRAQIDAGRTPNRILVKFFASPFQKHPVTPVQYLMLPLVLFLVTIFVGVPTYLGVHYGLTQAAHWHWLEPKISAHASIWTKIYGGDYDGLIVGLFVGVVAGRTYTAYLFANTMNASRNWVARGRKAHWWMPWPTRELIRDLQTEGIAKQRAVLAERSNALLIIVPAMTVLGIALAVFGYFVLKTNGFTH